MNGMNSHNANMKEAEFVARVFEAESTAQRNGPGTGSPGKISPRRNNQKKRDEETAAFFAKE